MRILYTAIIFSAALLNTASAHAQPLYKSVNERGEVTFSDSPPDKAVEVQKIEVEIGPTEAQRLEGVERTRRIESQANELGESNAQREQQRLQAQQQMQQQAIDTKKRSATEYYDGPTYPNRPVYPPVIRPPVRPERPILPDRPGRPVHLPAAPISAPGR